jgi:hypothetical protein
MGLILTACPGCGSTIELRTDAEAVICSSCGESFEVSRHEGAIALTRLPSAAARREDNARRLVEERLGEIDELLTDGEAEIEALRSQEKSGALRVGCSIFGVFLAVLAVSVLFMLIGRRYFGGWQFSLVMAAVILLGLLRVRQKVRARAELEGLAGKREEMEAALSDLQSERNRLASLASRLTEASTTPPDNNKP